MGETNDNDWAVHHRRNLEQAAMGYIGQAVLDDKDPVQVAKAIRAGIDALLGVKDEAK